MQKNKILFVCFAAIFASQFYLTKDSKISESLHLSGLPEPLQMGQVPVARLQTNLLLISTACNYWEHL